MVSRPLYWADKQLMLYVTVTFTLDLLTQKSIGIINGPTKTPIKVSLSLIDFKLLSRQGLPDEGHCDLDLYPTDPKINRDHVCVMANWDINYQVPKLNSFQVNKWTRN